MHLNVFLVHIIYQTEMERKSFQRINELNSWFSLSLWIIYSYISEWWKLWINPINLPDGKNKSICLDECLLGSNLVLLSAAFHRQSPADRLYVVSHGAYIDPRSLCLSLWRNDRKLNGGVCLLPDTLSGPLPCDECMQGPFSPTYIWHY